MSDSDRALLGGQTASRFLRRYWQKTAHLVRGAVPGFDGMFDRASLMALAARDDVESRLVVNERGRYALVHGPFRHADFKALPARGWTLLVQGLNLHSNEADALLRRFSFLPFARLDDLMASYAVPGGGVGPHFDSYDVFLLQGFGRRRWRYGRQRDRSLLPDLPVKILRTFTPEEDHVLAPGDMLYLPPHYAHDGVALEACTTYSIGFRAASGQELASAFLDFLSDTITVDGRYADPDLVPTSEPARIGRRMQRRTADMLKGIRWDDATVARFLGGYLSEPKTSIVFDPPRPSLSRAAFVKRIRAKGLVLDRRTQLLYDEQRLYVNGAEVSLRERDAQSLRDLANARRLSARACAVLAGDTLALLHDWYRDGFLTPGE